MTLFHNRWTEERRRKQAERCRQNKPWQNATGPKTETGKQRVAENAIKHNLYSPDGEALQKLLTLHRRLLVRLNQKIGCKEE